MHIRQEMRPNQDGITHTEPPTYTVTIHAVGTYEECMSYTYMKRPDKDVPQCQFYDPPLCTRDWDIIEF